MRSVKFCLFWCATMIVACVMGAPQTASALGVVNVNGTVTSVVSSGRFVFQTGYPHGYVGVFYSQQMVVPIGAQVKVGQTLTVTGTFNVNRQLVATNVNVGSISATGRYHIATWAYDSYWSEGQNASAANVNQLLTYAQGNAKSSIDCHSGFRTCKAAFYVNPNHVWDGSQSACVHHPDADLLAAASESWFVHNTGYADAAHRVMGKSTSGCNIWQMNPNSPGLQNWVRSYLRTVADNYDLYFLDDDSMLVTNQNYFSSGGGCIPWPSICHSTQEVPDIASEIAAHSNFVNAMTHTNGSPMYFMFQGASFNVPVDVAALNTTSRLVGLSCEGCVATQSTAVRPSMYQKVLDEMASVNRGPGSYLLISHGNFPAGSATQILQRLATIGIVWLGYSEGHTIVQTDLENNTTNLAVWPEDLIYPSNPLQSMVTSSTDLAVAPGVYRREFSTCYQRGSSFGSCAVIVNSTPFSMTVKSAWLHPGYHHAVALSGGDVLSGGVANIAGASFVPDQTQLQTGSAILLTP